MSLLPEVIPFEQIFISSGVFHSSNCMDSYSEFLFFKYSIDSIKQTNPIAQANLKHALPLIWPEALERCLLIQIKPLPLQNGLTQEKVTFFFLFSITEIEFPLPKLNSNARRSNGSAFEKHPPSYKA